MALSDRSLDRLKGVHPSLIRVVRRAAELSTQPFLVLEGVRTPERQRQLYAQGRTKPGNVVTWTLKSNHFVNAATGFGHAVDLCPDPVDWHTASKFDAIYAAMMAAAKELGVEIRSGMDWDRDGKKRERGESDSPHFELFGTPANPARPILRLGDKGDAVAILQRALHGEGFDPGKDDGDFGKRTERALIAFQQSRVLKTDGIAGPRVWAALEA